MEKERERERESWKEKAKNKRNKKHILETNKRKSMKLITHMM